MAANQKTRKGYDRAGAPPTGKPVAKARGGAKSSSRTRTIGIIAGVIVVAAIAIGGVFLLMRGGTGGGSWTNISVGQLAKEMQAKDFTLLNVKTPYIGEIEGTDLYIPYDQLAARASELPADKKAKIVVYCRTGNESTIASKTLVGLGYTNIQNVEGGMVARAASGLQIVQKNR